MKSPVQSCPYKTNDKQCRKGWYMIEIISIDDKIRYECPKECKDADFLEK